MVVNYPPDFSGVERKIEEGVKQLKKLEWYQKPVWIDGSLIRRKDVERKTHQKEDDHFYPHNFKEKGYVGEEINNILNLHFLSKDENDSKGKQIPSEWLSAKISEYKPTENKIKKYFQRNLLPFKSFYDLKRFEKKFIRKKGRIWPEKFQKRYQTFLWKRYDIFVKEFDKLQNGN